MARDQAQLDFDRNQKLMDGNAIPKAQLDTIRSRLDAAQARITGAKARLDEATTMLRDSSIRAPFTGTLARRNLEQGALAAPGVPVFTLTDVRSVKVVVGVPELVREQLSLGSETALSCDAFPNKGFLGRITRIAGIADPRSHVFEVEISVPKSRRRAQARHGRFRRARRQDRGSDGNDLAPCRHRAFPAGQEPLCRIRARYGRPTAGRSSEGSRAR